MRISDWSSDVCSPDLDRIEATLAPMPGRMPMKVPMSEDLTRLTVWPSQTENGSKWIPRLTFVRSGGAVRSTLSCRSDGRREGKQWVGSGNFRRATYPSKKKSYHEKKSSKISRH